MKRGKYEELIDGEIWAFIDRTNQWYPPETTRFPIERQRAIYDAMCREFHGGYPPGVRARDRLIDALGRSMPMRCYHVDGTPPAAMIVYYHGGGFILGGLDSHDDICAELCAGTGYDVLSAANTPNCGGLNDGRPTGAAAPRRPGRPWASRWCARIAPLHTRRRVSGNHVQRHGRQRTSDRHTPPGPRALPGRVRPSGANLPERADDLRTRRPRAEEREPTRARCGAPMPGVVVPPTEYRTFNLTGRRADAGRMQPAAGRTSVGAYGYSPAFAFPCAIFWMTSI
jgi:hypothetical protein